MNNTNNSTGIMKVVCAILFLFFTFFYLYLYQADVLAMAQHVLSGGRTTYNALVGAVLLTFLLYLLQILVAAIVQLNGRAHALTYFPSLLLLTVLTDISPAIDEGFHFGWWWLALPLLIAAYIAVVWFCRQVQPFEQYSGKMSVFFSPLMAVNVGTLGVFFLLAATLCDNSDVFHYRMKMEGLMAKQKYAEALEVGRNSLATDSSLTCLRVICLEKTHQLGSRLFTYPLVGGSKSMIPNGTSVKVMMWKDPKVRIFLRKGQRIYPQTLEHRLTAYLLDKDIDGFAACLKRSGKRDYSQLPVHIREALTLYTHKRANALVVYHNDVMNSDFADFLALQKKYPDPVSRRSAVRDAYKNTYWYYFEYAS